MMGGKHLLNLRDQTRKAQLTDPPDEPRRSVRATKGQHTKMDLDSPAETKKRGKKGKKQAAAEEEEEETIRCVCGVTTTDEDSGEAWIACDKCGVWQHNICVGVSTYEDEIPQNYMCEECDPKFHKALLDAIARGEKPWEENQRKWEAKQREEEAAKKKGKKGKGKRLSEPKSEVTNGKANSPSTPVPEAKKGTPASKGKRKELGDGPKKESAKVVPPTRSISNILTLSGIKDCKGLRNTSATIAPIRPSC